MPDYVREIQNGTMMIRDTGGDVQFWFKTGSSTYNYQQTWGYQANGGYVQRDFRMERGGAWQMFGAVNVGTDQDVMFRIIGEGLGWPTTDFVARIERLQIPPPPFPPTIWSVGSTFIEVGWGGDGGVGGASITSREIWISHDGTPRILVSPEGHRLVVNGLQPGTPYYFFARNANAKGMSGFGASSTARTGRVPDAPSPVEPIPVSQTIIDTNFNFHGRWDGGSPIREWQITYGTDPFVGQFTRNTQSLRNLLTNLKPATTHFFWVRARNDVGWGPWSIRTEAVTWGGAWVAYQKRWHRAVPWININGRWFVVQPIVKLNEQWRVTRS